MELNDTTKHDYVLITIAEQWCCLRVKLDPTDTLRAGYPRKVIRKADHWQVQMGGTFKFLPDTVISEIMQEYGLEKLEDFDLMRAHTLQNSPALNRYAVEWITKVRKQEIK